MRRIRALLSFGTALIAALLTSISMHGYLKKVRVTQLTAEMQPIAVAAADIPWGTRLTLDMIKKVNLPKGSLPRECLPDPTAIADRIVLYPIKANEPILESKLAPADLKTGGIPALISPKKRAVSVKVDKVVGVCGFVQPGSRVDVMMTLTTRKNYQPVTKMILENLLVLAVGSETKDKFGLVDKTSPVDTITLEVTPEEAEKLAMAAAEGKLHLTLRGYSDTDRVFTSGTTISNLLLSHSPRPVSGIKPTPKKGSDIADSKPRSSTPFGESRGSSESVSPTASRLAVNEINDRKEPSIHVVEVLKGTKSMQLTFEMD